MVDCARTYLGSERISSFEAKKIHLEFRGEAELLHLHSEAFKSLYLHAVTKRRKIDRKAIPRTVDIARGGQRQQALADVN
jgi:hypothetical protein